MSRPVFGPSRPVDGEAAVSVTLDHVAGVPKLGADRVDGQAEETGGRSEGLGGADVLLGGGAITELEAWMRTPPAGSAGSLASIHRSRCPRGARRVEGAP